MQVSKGQPHIAINDGKSAKENRKPPANSRLSQSYESPFSAIIGREATALQAHNLKVAGFKKSIGKRGKSKVLEGISSTSNLQVVIMNCVRFGNSLDPMPASQHLISANLSFAFFQRNSIAVQQNAVPAMAAAHLPRPLSSISIVKSISLASLVTTLSVHQCGRRRVRHACGNWGHCPPSACCREFSS